MLFDPRPKTSRSDLFNYEEELSRLIKLFDDPLVVVSGLRRTGKTSLVLTALNESGKPYLYVDLREGFSSYRQLYTLLAKSVSELAHRASKRRGILENLMRLLSRIRGVSIYGLEISISWSRREKPLLSELFGVLDEIGGKAGERVVVVFDEFQHSRGSIGWVLHNAIAHSYDFDKNLAFVLTGSEMGVLYGILRNPENPLYGRAYGEVRTRKLTREESIVFLEKGFNEAQVRVEREELERVVEELDGIIGWLAYYGYLRLKSAGNLENIVEEAVALAKSELESFLSTRVSGRYRLILKLLAEGVREWRALKRHLEKAEGREVSDRALYEVLQQLKSHSIIDEENSFTDPVVKKAALRL
ncbi:MAG: ATP-binding protein [Thermofilaceae archaeon]|nr:ATP-binding protein [Thermofilaceae archaeon]